MKPSLGGPAAGVMEPLRMRPREEEQDGEGDRGGGLFSGAGAGRHGGGTDRRAGEMARLLGESRGCGAMFPAGTVRPPPRSHGTTATTTFPVDPQSPRPPPPPQPT